jgi:hypothetical protein
MFGNYNGTPLMNKLLKNKSILGHYRPLKHYCMSILWKLAVYIEKPPVTSLNCYETIKDASMFIRLLWIGMLNLKFPVTMVTRGHLKIARNHYFALFFFPSKHILKCCDSSMDWERVKGFSALVTYYLLIDLRFILASNKSKPSLR